MNTLCLSGWAQPYDALRTIAPHAHHLDYAALGADGAVQAIADYNPDIAIGWSLGGVLLMSAKAHKLINPQAMIILGAPLQYVADKRFPHGMGQETFARFYENMTSDPARSSEKFNHLLAYGDAHYERITAELQAYAHQPDWGDWLPWLDLLAQQHRDTFPLNSMGRMLLIYGEEDVIVSAEQGKIISGACAKATLQRWDGCSHVPHMHDPTRLQDAIRDFCGHDVRQG